MTADCGTTSVEPFAEARRLGMDVVVLDHHQAPETLPDAIVVNPNRQDDVSGQGALCAAGVAFVALVALNRALRQRGFWRERQEPDLLGSLDLVALATVADVAPLTGLNRAFVTKGLAVDEIARPRGLAGSGRCRRAQRPAARLSPRFFARAAHQRRGANRRRGAGRPASAAQGRNRGRRNRRRTRPAQWRAPDSRKADAPGGFGRSLQTAWRRRSRAPSC